VGFVFLSLFVFIHFYLSYLICSYFDSGYEIKLNRTKRIAIAILTGPISFVLTLLVLYFSPLQNMDAGIMDGGLILIFLVFTPIFFLISYMLVKSASLLKFR